MPHHSLVMTHLRVVHCLVLFRKTIWTLNTLCAPCAFPQSLKPPWRQLLLPNKHLHFCYLFDIRSVDVMGIKHDFLCISMKDEGLTAPEGPSTWVDPESFVKGFKFDNIFFLVDEGIEPKRIQIPLLMGHHWPAIKCWLGSFVIFQWIWTSIARKPYIFVIFQ